MLERTGPLGTGRDDRGGGPAVVGANGVAAVGCRCLHLGMRITRLAATDFLSFESLDLEVPPGLSVIVGPNGSGKSNLGRVLTVATAGAIAGATGDFSELVREWSQAGRYGTANYEVRVGINFDGPDERSLLDDWARAAMICALRGAEQGQDVGWDLRLHADFGGAEALGAGELIVQRDVGRDHPWVIAWETAAAHMVLWTGSTLAPGPLGAPQPDRQNLIDWLVKRNDPLAGRAGAGPGPSTLRLADILASGPLEMIVRPSGSGAEIEQIRALRDAFGVQSPSSAPVTLGMVLHRLIGEGLLVTANRRAPVTSVVEPMRLAQPPVLSDRSGLGLELLRRKNGTAEEREAFRDAGDLFCGITRSRLEVRLQPLEVSSERTDVLIAPLVIEKAPDGIDYDVPLRLAGAGVEESAHLAVLLTTDKDVLVLDEPATNVSAVAQRRLLASVRAQRATTQTLLITHSAHMVPVRDVRDLEHVIRLARPARATTVHRPSLSDADRYRELLFQSEVRDLLFAAGVVLVEGRTELEALTVWFDQVDELSLPTPSDLHVALLSVDGDSRFAKYAELMDILGVPYAIVADGPAMRGGGRLSKLPDPAPDPDDATDETFVDAVARWAPFRVRTLADRFGDDGSKTGEIEAAFARYDAKAWAEISRGDKPRRGYAFARTVGLPDDVLELWRNLIGDLGLELSSV